MHAETLISPGASKFVVGGEHGFEVSLCSIPTRGPKPQMAKLIHSKTNPFPSGCRYRLIDSSSSSSMPTWRPHAGVVHPISRSVHQKWFTLRFAVYATMVQVWLPPAPVLAPPKL